MQVCAYCQSIIVRQDRAVADWGKTVTLLDDVSPIQVGTRGQSGGALFCVVGRQRVLWSAGSWNEWFLLFDDGSAGWLGEDQGFFMVTKPVASVLPVPDLLTPGAMQTLANQTFEVTDVKIVTYVGAEGELPHPLKLNQPHRSIDLRGDHGHCASITYVSDAPNETAGELFVGRYQDFDAFQFSALRVLDGW